jgi:hypothetical protein
VGIARLSVSVILVKSVDNAVTDAWHDTNLKKPQEFCDFAFIPPTHAAEFPSLRR